MRARPFISASEQPRPYSEIVSERGDRTRELVTDEIARLEAESAAAKDLGDSAESARLQCLAEDLRCALDRK